MSEKFVAAVSKRGIVELVLQWANDADTKRLSTRIWICSPTRTTFERNDNREVKVAQLTGSVAEMSAYHHDEQSLCSTIVNLTQNFVSSNNINLLYPRDQFRNALAGE
ncbi:hypothetical protein quinque_002087 [Culex quinquefasciatus]